MDVNFQYVISELSDGLYITDTNRKISYWNAGAEKITGFKAEEVVGSHCYDNILIHIDEKGNSLCKGSCPLAASLLDGKKRDAEVFLHHKNGHRKPVYVKTLPLRDQNGIITGCAELFIDLSSETALGYKIEELKKLAFYDELTGLSNRRYAERNMEIVFAEKQRTGLPFGILFFDIDKFKLFNDKYGHDNGDNILKIVSETIKSNTRPYDIYGRWGGEEFIGIIRNPDFNGLKVIAEKLRILVENSKLKLGEEYLNVTISIGGTLASDSDTIPAIIKRADELMYESKNAGRNRVTLK